MLLIALLAAVLTTPRPADLKTFRDWAVGCDNGLACHATSLMPDGQIADQPVMMSIERGAGARDLPEIRVRGEGKPGRLLADGRTLRARLRADDGDWRIEDGGIAETLAAFRSARTISIETDGGRPLGKVSLAGARAALLYIDEAQKRLGTVTALARPGLQPADAVPPPPALPHIVAPAASNARGFRVGEDRIAALRKQAGCIAEPKDQPGYDSEQVVLDDRRTLILLGCGAGAYNFSSIPYIARRAGAAIEIGLARFDLAPSWGEGGGPPMLVNAGWDAKHGILTSFAKGRGIGDCGVGSDYAWDGTRFRLIRQIEMSECRGSLDYITTWRAVVGQR
ncbi:MAG: hypothetical protein JWN69_356 [Alphaproteobacteria bacterium]|nr:hypothetical protein [Alphaproteobacteria bacterium]